MKKPQNSFKSFFVLFLLTACSNHSNWQSSHIYSQDKKHTSRRFVFQDPIAKELTLEIIVYHLSTKCYLHSLDILPPSEDRQIPITIQSRDKTFTGNAYCLKGGQKVVFSDDLSDKLLDLLKDKQQITIYCNQSELDVLPDDFIDLFEKKQNKVAQLITSFF